MGVGLLDLYFESGDASNVLRVFGEMPKIDVIPWSFMISRYAQSNQSREAVELFGQMRQSFYPSKSVYSC